MQVLIVGLFGSDSLVFGWFGIRFVWFNMNLAKFFRNKIFGSISGKFGF